MTTFCKLILPCNEIHKLPTVPKTYEELNGIALKKFKGKIPEKFYFKYKDIDNELVTLSDEEDFRTALTSSESDNIKTLRIFLIPEMGQLNHNTNYSAQNFTPASYMNFPNENSLDKGARNKLLVSHAYSHGHDRRVFDNSENIGDADLSRIAGQVPLTLERNRKSRSNPDEAEPQGHDDKHFSFERSAFLEGNNQITGVPFNQDQLNTISELLDRKLREKIEQNMRQVVMAELMSKLQDDYRNKSMKKNNPYTYTPYMGKSAVQTAGRSSVKKQRTGQENEETICSDCQKKIEDIKYTCLECFKSEFCEDCETKGEHPHPLLKTRLSKKNKVDNNEQQNTGPTSKKAPESDGNLSVANNKSQSIGTFGGAENRRIPENKSFGNKGFKYSNSFANIELPRSDDSFHAKNPSSFSRTQAHLSQSMVYGKNLPTPGETPFEKEIKKYKASIIKPPIYDLIIVKPGYIYNVEFTIKNPGPNNWPEDVKVICVAGIHKGIEQNVPALVAKEQFVVKLELKAPEDPQIYLSQWRLQYFDEGQPKPFGSNLYIEIHVKGEKKRVDKNDEVKPENKENVEKVEKGEKGPASQPLPDEKVPEKERVKPIEDGLISDKKDKEIKSDELSQKQELTEEEQRIMRGKFRF